MQISRIRLSNKTHAFAHERSSTVHPTNDTGLVTLACSDRAFCTKLPMPPHGWLFASRTRSRYFLRFNMWRLPHLPHVAGWDFHPPGKRRLFTAHATIGNSKFTQILVADLRKRKNLDSSLFSLYSNNFRDRVKRVFKLCIISSRYYFIECNNYKTIFSYIAGSKIIYPRYLNNIAPRS